MYHPPLPLELEPFRQQFEATARPYLKILPQPAGETALWQSKIGGIPYLPVSAEYPHNSKGEPLFFLAQLNFSEMPALELFPREGIVEFYINNGGLFGWQEDDSLRQQDYRVLFFEKAEHDKTLLQQKLPHFVPVTGLPIPADLSFPLDFRPEEEIVPLSDFLFSKLFGKNPFEHFGTKQWDIMNDYAEMHSSDGHKIGGYAFFTQADPREHLGEMELLFQLDSDIAIQSMWGDLGVGHFFIPKEDLQQRDFSNAYFTWDCF